jgi:hypothetical protein
VNIQLYLATMRRFYELALWVTGAFATLNLRQLRPELARSQDEFNQKVQAQAFEKRQQASSIFLNDNTRSK